MFETKTYKPIINENELFNKNGRINKKYVIKLFYQGYTAKDLADLTNISQRYFQRIFHPHMKTFDYVSGVTLRTPVFNLRHLKLIMKNPSIIPQLMETVFKEKYIDNTNKIFKTKYIEKKYLKGLNYGLNNLTKAERAAARSFLRAIVFERDDYECDICGTHIALNCHHLLDVKDYPEIGLDPDNCIILCDYHHQKAHNRIRGDVDGD